MSPDPTINPRNRLWTPWRMTYVGGERREPGCVFCNRLDSDDDVASLIVHRARRSFVILNLYPYNTGHLMVVPNAHVQDPSQLDAETQAEMARLTGSLTGLLRRVLDCAGFNVGMNIGHAAGAGIAEHLHQHVVPRWVGDANFMPIVGSTKVLPELLPATYGKIRAEVERDIRTAAEVKVLVLVGEPASVVIGPSGLPIVPLEPDVAVWKSATGALSDTVAGMQVLGWGGESSTGEDDRSVPVLAIRGTALRDPDSRFGLLPATDAGKLSNEDQEIVRRGLIRYPS